MYELTERQADILQFIIDFKKGKDRSPTFREVARNYSITVKGAWDHLQALRKKGYIKFEEGNYKGNRNIEILKLPDGTEIADDREICRQEFEKTAIENTPYNWHIWKRAWTTARDIKGP